MLQLDSSAYDSGPILVALRVGSLGAAEVVIRGCGRGIWVCLGHGLQTCDAFMFRVLESSTLEGKD